VVVDTSSSFDEMLLSILERSDFVLIVVDMDLLSVKNAKLALDTLRLLKFPSSKIRLVLNRANARARLDEREIEKTLGTNVAARIPSDAAIPASVNEGRPVVLSSPKSKTARGFEEVAALITGTRAGPVRGRRSRWR
jgi:pilus assembly protein CpaE